MKEKIVGIVILMLVTTMVVSATNINMKREIQPTASSVDVPVWKKGDSWTYDFHELTNKYDTNGTLWYTSYHNSTLTMTVTDDTGDNYTLEWTSTNNEGKVIIGKYQLKFTPFTKYTGENDIRKTDLACMHELHQEKGFAFLLIRNILPFPAQYNHLVEMNFTKGWQWLPFPLNAGTNGTIPGDTQILREKASLYWGLISLFDFPEKTYILMSVHYHCEMANITLPAGTYNAYNVSVNLGNYYNCWRYYVPEVGYIAKTYLKSDWNPGKLGYIAEMELVDYNYTP